MQAVPSLVGTGTVVAAAATGLVIGQSVESNLAPSSRPSSPFARPLFLDYRFDDPRATPTPPPISRPGTGSGVPLSPTVDGPNLYHDQPHPSPLFSHPFGSARCPPTSGKQVTSPLLSHSRRQSYIRTGDVAAANTTDAARDSISSHSSWMRRLSLRPTSQHESPRSSLGPDSSLSLSQGSGAPVLSPTSASPAAYPNKLIKRMGTTRESIFARRESKGQVPTLRRPATSHQRSATVQQVPLTPALHQPPSEASLRQSSRPRAYTTGQAILPWRRDESSTWTSFFHMRRVRTLRRRNLPASNESSLADNFLPGIRIQLRRGDKPVPCLIHPHMVSGEVFELAVADSVMEQTVTTEASIPLDQSPQVDGRESLDQSDDTPTKKARRSFSTQFGPNSGWKARAGSLRRPKRSSEEHSASRRYASDPTSSASPNAAQSDSVRAGMEELFTPPKSLYRDSRKVDIFASQDQARECPSPISPSSRLSSFHGDLFRAGPSPPSSAGFQAVSPTQLSPTAAPLGAPVSSHSRAVSKEGAVTLAGSEMSVPGLASGDDDTDYKSDALFDSFRTTDTDNFRMAETPIDTMFDDSFHGASGPFKTKRLSIQEILGNSWDGDTRIMEEEEGSATPMKGLHDPRIAMHGHSDDRATEIAKFQLSMGDRERSMGRLSLDTTDDDYDWARDDDDGLSNPLSPPVSSLNSRRGASPPPRSVFASISGDSPSDSYTIASPLERPRSNLFDWAEPSHEANDGELSRPKTARGQQEQDHRGGRVGGRKGFPPVHVRSQSVPVVPDPHEAAKGAPKFGTWAVGNMNTNEDWDDDFDFDEASNAGSGSGSRPAKGLSMRVPKPIQATQSTVKAHSGQIRELSLLVSSLKRLFRQGRELGLLDGQAALLWKEAENIIELASPDEDEPEASDTDRSFSDFDPSTIDERFLDEGFDAATLDRSDDTPEGSQPDIPKNAVVKERTVVRRRSVFSPDDDIFGNNLTLEVSDTRPHTPRTPDRVREFHTADGAVVSSVMAAMEQQRARPGRPQDSPLRPSKAKLFFDTNSLQELVKRASTVFHSLSDIVRREELLTMSPQSTPRHDRQRRGGSPAFTRVFSDPDAGSPRHLVQSQKSHSSMPRKSVDSNGLGQLMQMMTVG